MILDVTVEAGTSIFFFWVVDTTWYVCGKNILPPCFALF
jgi:hypothetical protein